MKRRIQSFIADIRGSMAIETAFVAPMLIIMTLGTFEVGTIVARQHELQSAANEAEIIIMATNVGATVEISEVETILRDSVGLSADKITVDREYRCNQANGKVKDKGNCAGGAVISEYITVSMTDSYTPTWTAFGVGKAINFSVDRSVQIS
ncbi:pilus assembly protein [Erythrobacter insulae]|uniref:Pilus assembly protein n=1 Tax=Erythrobacter insulae TaxID=2584124 RepID=A0A547PEM2_9SPHN|nr:TadE family protein [Erythrobacter insulae]TRD12586.1 pilus assembly protein [Erythrobacter insulae]